MLKREWTATTTMSSSASVASSRSRPAACDDDVGLPTDASRETCARGDQRVNRLGSEATDVEGLARRKVANRALQLRGAGQAVGTTIEWTVTHDARVAFRAAPRHGERPDPTYARAIHASDDVGDDVAGTNDTHAIANAQVLASDLLAVVRRRTRDRHTADVDGTQHGDGRQHAGPAHLHDDVLDDGLFLVRRELEGERPPRMASGRAQAFARGQIVELEHDAVDLVRQRAATRLQLAVKREDVVEGVAVTREWTRVEAPLAERLEQAQAVAKLLTTSIRKTS